jgi:hypothetical protein
MYDFGMFDGFLLKQGGGFCQSKSATGISIYADIPHSLLRLIECFNISPCCNQSISECLRDWITMWDHQQSPNYVDRVILFRRRFRFPLRRIRADFVGMIESKVIRLHTRARLPQCIVPPELKIN